MRLVGFKRFFAVSVVNKATSFQQGYRASILHPPFAKWSSSLHIRFSSDGSTDLPPPNEELKEALTRIGIQDKLEPLSDLGYYGWNPTGSYNPLSSVTAEDIRQMIDFTRKPKTILDVQALRATLPRKLSFLEPFLVENLFPFGQHSIASLYVATNHKGVDPKSVNFMFGSYSLFLLATGELQDDGEKFIVMRIPSTGILFVSRYKAYTNNLSAHGHQFERFLLGTSPEPPYDHSEAENLQLMKIGNSTVLISGEVDAVDCNGTPTEVKLGNKQQSMKTLSQMISSASLQLCRGNVRFWQRRGRKKLRDIKRIEFERLEDFATREMTSLNWSG
ncbi:expressed unknown protein [Seminavis robusta]|uniref:Uncharacterized protein n=1 Tax=Seminavis robusta TaxID=568900 RepID=A0A9N8DT22_9STRA|nr:expressed unknown protein [Seminavis robusta]|eukprot:Sro334_g119810.1 n/a (333) ;mRNA; r:41179-42177